jgi:hypothetical protein
MKSREEGRMIKAFTSIYRNLEANGHKSKHHVLDKEISLPAQNFLKF